jgi:hypothetical protein
MYFITGDELFAGDIVLETSAGVASNSDVVSTQLLDGGFVYFIGFISDSGPFSYANIRYGPAVNGVNFLYNVDDITTVQAVQPVPEPSTFALTSVLFGALWTRRRSARKNDVRSETCV